MPAPATIDELLDLSQKSGILDRKGLDDYLERKRQESAVPSAPGELAEAMVRDGLLTRFQAEQLLQGKWRNFLIANKFKLLERLGEGGMGVVFLCEHVRLRRRVALKLLPSDAAENPEVVERFEREARAVAALDHPNIVKVHDVDKEDKNGKALHYLVMEYAEGTTLQDIVRKKGPMDVLRAAHYICQAALGLQHAHEAGLVHRDVKPGNILLDRSGTVKILDLGLARFFHDKGDNLTREHDANAILGTADYLAPEQAIDSHLVDNRADIYSLGMTFYYLLAGTAPFAHGTLNQKLIWHQLRQPEPIADRRPDVPPELAAVLARMIAKDPDERFPNALEVAQALAPWAEAPIAPPPDDEMPELSPACSAVPGGPATSATGPLSGLGRRQAPVTSAALALHTYGGIRTAPVSAAAPPSTGLHLGDTAPVAPSELAEEGPAPGIDWERVFFWGRIAAFAVVLIGSGIGLAWWALSRERAPAVVQQGEPDAPRPKLSNNPGGPRPWKPPPAPLLNLNGLGAIAVLNGHHQPVERVAFSPDGKRAVSCSHDRTARLWEVATGQLLHTLAGHTDVVHDVAFSPDGKHVLTASYDRSLQLWDATTGKPLRRFTGHAAPVRSAAFSPDGKFILSGAGNHPNPQPHDCTLRLWDTASARSLKEFTGHQDAVWSVAFSPDGKRAVSGSYDGTARVWDLGDGHEVCRFTGHKGSVHGVAFSPDGRRVASGGGDHLVRLWHPTDARQERTFAGHSATVAGVAFSADGKHLLSASDDRSVRLWDADSGREVGTFLGHTSNVWGVCFSPDGRLALSCGSDNSVRLWGLPRFVEVVRPGLLSQFRVHLGKVNAVAVSSDGRLLLTGSDEHTARLWNVGGGALRSFAGHTGAVNAVAFAPDGRRLATAGDDRSVRLWDTHKGGKELRHFNTNGAARSVTFTPDGRSLLAGSADGSVRLWEVNSGKELQAFKGHTGSVNAVAVSPDGRRVLTAGKDASVRVWDLQTGKELLSFKGHTAEVRTAAFAPDGRLALSASADGTLRLWEAATGKLVHTIPVAADVRAAAFSPDGLRLLAADGKGLQMADFRLQMWPLALQTSLLNAQPATGVAFTPDGRRAVSCGPDGMLRVWGLSRPRGEVIGEMRRYQGHRQTLDRAAVSPDGRYALSAGVGQGAVVVLWEVASGLEMRRYPHPAGVRFVTFAPAGRHFVSCAEDGKARLWDVASTPGPGLQPREVRRFEGHRGTVWWAAFTGDGQRLFTGGADRTARLWDVATGKELKRFEGHQREINSVAVTPDGRRGLTASWDTTVRVWDLATGKETYCFRGHKDEARAVTVSPDGRQALSAGSDRVLQLWEIETGRPVREFVGHAGAVYFVAFAPDGKRVLSSGAGHCVRLWDVASGRTVHVYGGHEAAVPAVVFTPDGRYALSVSQDQTLRLWGLP